MKKIIASIAALCLLLSLTACGKQEAVEEKLIVRIGVFEPLSGGDAAYGRAELMGIQYAHDETSAVKVGGKTYDVELVVADNGGSAVQAAEAARSLIDADVSVVLGSYGGAVSAAGGQVFGQAGLAAVAATSGGADVTEGNDYYFSVSSTQVAQAEGMAIYAAERLEARLAYCLYEWGDESSEAMVRAFISSFEGRGGHTMADYYAGDSFEPLSNVMRAETAGADIIFAPVDVSRVSQLITLCASLEMRIAILGCGEQDDPILPEALAMTADPETGAVSNVSIYIPAFYAPGGNSAFDTGLRAYAGYDPEAEEPGADPVSAGAALGYDAYYIALEALKAANSPDRADVLAVLPGVSLRGVTGNVTFDETGNALRDGCYIRSAADGGWRLVRYQSFK